MDNTKTIPLNWRIVNVEDITLAIQYGYTASSTTRDTGIKFLRITDLQEYKVNWNEVPFCEIDEYDVNKFNLNEGDIVFARTGATVGKSFLIEGKIPKAIFASYLIRIRLSKGINPKYFFYFFQSGDYWKQINSKVSGIGQPNVNAKSLALIKLPLPPLSEQQKIVLKIEELFTELSEAEATITKTLKMLDVYKFITLLDGFSGKLTSLWRKQNNRELGKANKSKKISSDEMLSFPPLPKKWIWSKIGIFSELISTGATPKGGRFVYTNSGIPFIRSQNVHFGKIFKDNIAFISQEMNKKISRTSIRPNDVLLNITGASIGRSAFVPEDFGTGNVNQHVCVIRMNSEVTHKYLSYFLNSPFSQSYIKKINSGATREALTMSQINNFPFPFCSLEEQNEIVEQIEYRLTIAENLFTTIQNNLRKINGFRYVILDRAFRGALIEQDGNPESIELILNEIKIEKETFLINQKEILKLMPKRKKLVSQKKSILQILEAAQNPLSAKDVWLQSIHKDDIESFYSELRVIQDKIIEVKKDTESLLSIRHENR